MDRSPRIAAIVVLALLLLAAATLMAGCSQQQPLTVRVSDHPTYGKILTDSTGRSLYIQARDVPNTGAVSNLGEVGRFYPPFYAERVDGGNGINVSEFGHITRADGKQQTTFRGWPLYYYINDREPGDAKSQGANNITFVAKPDYTVMVRENVTLGVYLTDTAGRPLVSPDGDIPAEPGAGYLPFRVSSVVAPAPLVRTGEFGEARAPSGELQTTYGGRLLYVWSGGARAGAAPDAGGYLPVVVAPGGTLTGAIETPTPTGSTAATPAPAGTSGTTVPATTAPTTATATRSGNDAYTGGQYTPTPFRTVEVARQDNGNPPASVTWTPIPSGQATAVPTTPLPTVSTPGTTTTLPTTPSATPTATTTSPTTVIRTTLAPVRTPTTPPTTLPPTTIATTPPTTVPVPITTPPTTVPIPNTPTTLPLPFPITSSLPPNPAVSTQGGNAS